MNKNIKKILAGVMLFSASFCFAASKKSIVCTSFPQYDWVMNVLGNKSSTFDVVFLQNKGTDLHSYQPSIKDIAKITKSDLFVYVGGESDEWVDEVLENASNKNQIVVNMMEVLGDKVREEEIVEGMQVEEEDDHHEDHEHHHAEENHDKHHHEEKNHEHHHEEGEVEYDEHVWLSLTNAIEITKVLCNEICKVDAKNEVLYKKNADEYISKLSDLDNEYKKVVNSADKKTVLFADRYPFRYLTEDYNLKYYAAFVGCSAESEASFETIVFLANKVDELKLNAILTIEKSDKKMARTVIESTKNKNQKILEMDSLQSITSKEISGGKNYLSVMEKNLEVLKIALN